jgi:hypothetical protein
MTTPATTEALDFVVRRDDVRVHACRPAARSRPHAGQVLLRIDRFGFTAKAGSRWYAASTAAGSIAGFIVAELARQTSTGSPSRR